MRILHAIILAAALTGAASAQTMYRCGNTFSQQHCGPDAKVMDITPPEVRRASAVTPEVVEANKRLCEFALRLRMKDPESARITNVSRLGVQYYNIPNTPPGVTYTALVNGKNSYGGYTGEDSKICIFSLDETKFVKVLGD